MSLWKQLLLSVVVVLMAGLAAVMLSQTAADFLARNGFAGPMQILGLTQTGSAPADGDASGAGNARSGRPGAGRKATVVLQPAGTALINDKVTALGTSVALQSVMVVPKANGTLIEVLVQSGAKVTSGQVLARLDSEAQLIALDKAKLASADARRTLDRNKALVASNAAPVTQTQAVELAAELAVLEVRSATQDLADRVIFAPISGVAGIVKVSPGNSVTPQTEIVSIEDSSALMVNFWLPERLAGQLKPGAEVTLVPVARPALTLAAVVSSIDNQIDPASGTFQVQAQVPNPDGTLQPGMAFTVSMRFPGQSLVTVNPLSVQWGSDGAYVWRVAEDKAEKVPLRVVQRNTETVLVAGDISQGDQIVTEGLDGLKAGAEVQVFGAPPSESGAPAKGAGATTPAGN